MDTSDPQARNLESGKFDSSKVLRPLFAPRSCVLTGLTRSGSYIRGVKSPNPTYRQLPRKFDPRDLSLRDTSQKTSPYPYRAKSGPSVKRGESRNRLSQGTSTSRVCLKHLRVLCAKQVGTVISLNQHLATILRAKLIGGCL